MLDKTTISNKGLKKRFAQLQINVPMKQQKKGEIIRVEVDEAGKPVNSFWRRRHRDAQTDNCVTVVMPIAKGTQEKEDKETK